MAIDSAALPASLKFLLAQAPAETVDACRREWAELMALQERLVAESELGVSYEPAEADAELQRVVASLDAEEVRWRDAAHTIERRWLADREALIGWWRSDDAAALHKQVQAASHMADQLAEAVGKLPPSHRRDERIALAHALGVDALDPLTLLHVIQSELVGTGDDEAVTDATRLESLLR
eukprot:2645847-Prymnesium_polylepis.1